MDEVLGERVDFIEHQLSHMVKDANGRALQPHSAPAGKARDDAVMGRISGQAAIGADVS